MIDNVGEEGTLNDNNVTENVDKKDNVGSSQGSEGDDVKYCYKCGHQLSPDAVFCEKCGARVR